MDRLLSPNEAKFWLMDFTAPMNTVVVVRSPRQLDPEKLSQKSSFTLPSIVLDRHRRPRWARTEERGTIQEELPTGPDSWLQTAERLTDVRVGTEGSVPWHAVVIQHEGASTLVLAVHHSLADYRSGLWVARQFLEGADPGRLTPPCEELLPLTAYSRPDAESVLDQWWLPRASARWGALGPEALAEFLPPPCVARLGLIGFTEAETVALRERFEKEGVTLNGAVAVALRDVLGTRRTAHSVDLSRFTKPPLDDAPGIAISHVFAEVDDGEFWSSAREVRARVFEQIAAGAAADALLIMARALLGQENDLSTLGAQVVITGAPTLRRPGALPAECSTGLVVSSPRGGGDVVILWYDGSRLQLVSSCPSGRPPLPLEAIADRLRFAIG